MSASIDQLHTLGQSLWYDNIERRLLENGEMAAMIARGEIRGVTSNPSIFHNAISRSTDYDSALQPMSWAGWSNEDMFWQLAVEDIQAAADLFLPLYEQTHGGDGFVSLEVSPFLANKTRETISEAKRLWKTVNRPNLMIKIPATPAGIPAIRDVIAAGINVNVTLIFSLQRYREVMDAFLTGLEKRAAAGLPIDSIASVASFFISRVDSKIDGKLLALTKQEGANAELAAKLPGKAAIANARLAYALFKEIFGSDRFKNLAAKGAQLQRPLWASTSTKNPAYRDVLYIEDLIAPNTVNTVPPQTLKAFADHGAARLSLDGFEKESRQVIDQLESLGIRMDEITDALEAEGVKAFSDAFHALLKSVDDRRKAFLAQLGPYKKQIAPLIKKLDADQFSARIWAADPSLWTQDQSGQDEIRKRLGWLTAPQHGCALIPDLEKLAAELQNEGIENLVVLGMGGSSLAPEVFSQTFGVREAQGRVGLNLTIVDSTDPEQVLATDRVNPSQKTLYAVSSKSGGTAEVSAMLEFFWSKSVRRLGKREAARHFIAITDPNTTLEKTAQDRGFRKIFNADPNVGGRYSALIAFGLVPAYLLGVDLDQFLARAEGMMAQCVSSMPAGRNPGLVLGTVLAFAGQNGRDKVTLLADPDLSSVGSWLEQLIAESSGKEGKGLVPVDLEPQISPRSYSQDRIFVYLRLTGSEDTRVASLRRAGFPVLVLPLKDEYDLAAELYRWEYATATACAQMGVNAFDQPNVQDSKTRTVAKVKSYQETGQLDEGKPVWQGSGVKVYGMDLPTFKQAASIKEVVAQFLALAQAGDYVAVNAYLPRNPKTLARLQKLRKNILRRTGKATTLGFGPRFLHSTGQLHKGGANNGLFIQLTTEPARDAEIPTQNLSFKVLERAQALGDLEALLASGRRVIRIHLEKAQATDLI